MSFPERALTPPDDPMEAARDAWEAKFSMSETINREDLDYLCERVEAGDFKTLQQWIKDKQHQHFIDWKKQMDEMNDELRAEQFERERQYEKDRWCMA